jgi:hypothetical protein
MVSSGYCPARQCSAVFAVLRRKHGVGDIGLVLDPALDDVNLALPATATPAAVTMGISMPTQTVKNRFVRTKFDPHLRRPECNRC